MAKKKKQVVLFGSERLQLQILVSKFKENYSEKEILIAVLPKTKKEQSKFILAMKEIIKEYENNL